MEKIIAFIKKYKTQIISVIIAISAFASAFADLGGQTAKICEIVIAICSLLVIGLKHGIDATFIEQTVKLIKLLQDEFGIIPVVKKDTNDTSVASITFVPNVAKLSDQEIKALVVKYMNQ